MFHWPPFMSSDFRYFFHPHFSMSFQILSGKRKIRRPKMINMRLLDAWLGLVKLFPCCIFMFVWPPFMAGTITWHATEIVTFTFRWVLNNTRGTGVGERQGNQIFQNVRAAFQMIFLISSSLHIDSRTTPDGRVDHLKVTCGFWKIRFARDVAEANLIVLFAFWSAWRRAIQASTCATTCVC